MKLISIVLMIFFCLSLTLLANSPPGNTKVNLVTLGKGTIPNIIKEDSEKNQKQNNYYKSLNFSNYSYSLNTKAKDYITTFKVKPEIVPLH